MSPLQPDGYGQEVHAPNGGRVVNIVRYGISCWACSLTAVERGE